MDWQEIALIVILVLLILAGGYIKKLSGAVKALIVCFDEALQDDQITKEEWAEILKRGKDVFTVVADITKLVALKKGRS